LRNSETLSQCWFLYSCAVSHETDQQSWSMSVGHMRIPSDAGRTKKRVWQRADI